MTSPQPPTAGPGVPQTLSRARPRRRPSGEPPPLPRRLDTSGTWWLLVAAAAATFWCVVGVTGRGELTLDVVDAKVLRWVADVRSDNLTPVMRAFGALATSQALLVLWWANLIVMLVWRRWRHLFVWVGATILVNALVGVISEVVQRPRPLGIEILGGWQGFAMPSRNVAVLCSVLVCTIYALLPAGRLRGVGKAVAAVVVALTALSRLYLAQDSLTDVVVGVLIGVAVPLAGFRLFAPNDVFPVTYHRGRTAHLDVTGARGEAILDAMADQLGVVVTAVKPFNLEGSGGSTPLRVTVKGDPDTYLFAKLYATTHLRSDRWYKLGRTLLYGRLEDEKPYNTVRRLVQYEDYISRLLVAADLPAARPYGIVELTPEREYLLVNEFLDGAVEIGEAEVDDGIIDQGLEIIRKLWDAGLAHRDIKPANLMVRDGTVTLVDPAFAEVRPSPWRQAVDLGNMMLVLGLDTSATQVYERARLRFSDEEIAEAFAATRGLTMPSQLRRLMKQQGKDLHAEFTALLPVRLPPVKIQRWSVRRVTLTLVTLLGALVFGSIVISLLASPL